MPVWNQLKNGRRALVCGCGHSMWKLVTTDSRAFTPYIECMHCELSVKVLDIPEVS